MKKELIRASLLLLALVILMPSCKKCLLVGDDCSLIKDKNLVSISKSDNSKIFTTLSSPGACSVPVNSAEAYYSYGAGGRVTKRRSTQYGPVSTVDCGDYAGIGYACFNSVTDYNFNAQDNVSSVYHQMEQSHFEITSIHYDDKVNPLYDACNKNYVGNFAYYAPTTLGAHAGNSFYSSTLFQFIPLAKNNPTYLKFEGVVEPGFDSHIIELSFEYEYCNGYPAMVHIKQKNTDFEFTDISPTVKSSDGSYYIFNYEATPAKKGK